MASSSTSTVRWTAPPIVGIGVGPSRRWLLHEPNDALRGSTYQPSTEPVSAQETPIVGIGVETVGTDAGGAAAFEPPFPVHSYFLGAGKYGLTQLANLAEPPPTGAVIVVAPLKLVEGTGTPASRVRILGERLLEHGCVRDGQPGRGYGAGP